MNKYCVKIFATEPMNVLESVPVLHEWIQEKKVDGHMLIDVADYSHVWQGPGIMLIAHEGNFSLDQEGGKLGLLYQRKADVAEGLDAVEVCTRAALKAAALLEGDPNLAVKFGAASIEISSNDRVEQGAFDESLTTLEQAAAGVVSKLYPDGKAQLTRGDDPKARVKITVQGDAPDVKTLIDRLG